MRKLISFCLWGRDPKYLIGAVENALLREKFYNDWVCRFYIHVDVPNSCINDLEDIPQTESIIINSKPDWSFTVNRFKSMDDPDVSHSIFRDTDSRLSERESDAVNSWLNDETAIHVMRDHPRHGNFPILAGMWGMAKTSRFKSMTKMLEDYELQGNPHEYHYDQIFLNNYIWGAFHDSCTVHDEIFVQKPFPSPRFGLDFVGKVFNEKGETEVSHEMELKSHLMRYE